MFKFFNFCFFVHFECLCACLRVSFCLCGCNFGWVSGPPREPRRPPPRLFSLDLHAKVTSKPRLTKERPITQKRNPVTLREFAPAKPAHRWAAHNIFPLKYRTEYAVIPIFTEGFPEAPAARKQCKAQQSVKSVHTPEGSTHDKPAAQRICI